MGTRKGRRRRPKDRTERTPKGCGQASNRTVHVTGVPEGDETGPHRRKTKMLPHSFPKLRSDTKPQIQKPRDHQPGDKCQKSYARVYQLQLTVKDQEKSLKEAGGVGGGGTLPAEHRRQPCPRPLRRTRASRAQSETFTVWREKPASCSGFCTPGGSPLRVKEKQELRELVASRSAFSQCCSRKCFTKKERGPGQQLRST